MTSGGSGSRGNRPAFRRLVLAPALLCTLAVLAAAGSSPSRESSRVRSDRLVERKIDGRTVRFLYGNVFIDRDTLTAAADTAEDHVEDDFYFLYGRVVLTSGTTVLHCRQSRYTKTSGEADFSGDVRLIDGDMIGTSLRGEVRGNGRFVRLIDEARMDDPDFTVEADTIYRNRHTGLSMALGRVHIAKKPGPATPDTSGVSTAADSSGAGIDSTTADAGLRPARVDSGWTLDCDRAVFEAGGDRSDFFGSVRFEDGEMIGSATKAHSRRGGDLFRLMGEALLVTPDYTIRADTISRDAVTGLGEASGGVQIVDPAGDNLVRGEHAVFDDDAGTALVDSLPELTSRSEGEAPLSSSAGRMRFFREEDRVVMVDSVRIHQDETRARADSAVAYGRDRMVLFGSPEVRLGDTNRLVGDRIEFAYERGELRSMVLEGAARLEDATPDSLAAIYRGLPPLDVLSGQTITIDFEDGEIRRTQVVGGAASHYTPQDITDEIATNDVAGDTITIHFRDDRVRRVEVFGKVAGTYRYARIADMVRAAGSGSIPDSAAVSDTLAVTVADTLTAATGAADSTAVAPGDSLAGTLDFAGQQEEVDYKGDQVVFNLDKGTMEIDGNGVLDYGSMNHTAGHIILNTDTRELYSEDEPYLKDGEAVVGNRMGYNFKYKTGAVETGVTSMDGYYYVGDTIRRYPDGAMKIKGGRMTSCDQSSPHYHFWSNNMMMRQGDKVVAAPIVLKIGHVPVFALPFYFKSLKSGRQSGILFPSFDFGWSSREGRYIRDFGYYWATNDYMDFIFEGDYNEHQDFSFRLSNRYVKRYAFNGTIDYTRQIGLSGDNATREWQLRWNHNQPTLFDDYKFRADVRMSSRSLSNNDLTSSVRRDIVSGQMKSTVYLSRNWDFLNASLNASRDGRVNAEDDDPATDNLVYSMTLPALSLNFRQFTLKQSLRGGQKGSFLGNLLRNTYVQHSYNLTSDRKAYELTTATTYKVNGKASLALRPPRVGIFNVSFSANAGQDWTRETTSGTTWVSETDSTGFFDDVYERTENTRPSLSYSATLGTTLYGLFPVRVGKLRAMRHTTKFNASWNLSPAIGDKQRRSTSVSLGWSNRLDLKYATGADSAATKKLDGFIDWNLTTNYNPQKEAGDRWSDLSSTLSLKPGQSRYLQLKVTNSIDPQNLALKSTRFNYNLSFDGKLDLGVQKMETVDNRNSALDRLGEDAKSEQEKPKKDPDDPFGNQKDDAFANRSDPFGNNGQDSRKRQGSGKDTTDGGRYLPFRLNTSISYSYTNDSRTKRANANFSLSANLTRDWEFRYDTSFDLDVGAPVRQQFSLSRDLHCWALEFNRTLSAVDSQFGFRLYLKAIPALKFVRGRESALGGVGGGYGGF